MFRTRIPTLLCRMFRFRSRRQEKEKPSSVEVSQRSSSAPPQSCRSISSQPEPTDTSSPPSTPKPHSILVHSPSEVPTQGNADHVIVIEHDPVHSTITPPLTPILSVAPQIYIDGVLSPESPTKQRNMDTRRVSFQMPRTTRTEDPSETPISPCSTLVSQEVEYGYAIPMEPPPEDAEHTFGRAISTDSDAELNDLGRSGSRKTRHRSLFTPQPVRANMKRFSMPAARAAPNMPSGMMNARDGSRESKRATAIPVYTSGLGSAGRGRRQSRWSREMNKPETQEVLRALSEM